MTAAERVLAEVGEKAFREPIDEWSCVNEIGLRYSRVLVWSGGMDETAPSAGPAITASRRANLRACLVSLAALCVAAVAALDVERERGGKP